MKEEELKYLMQLLDDLSPDVYKEISQFQIDVQKLKIPESISDKTLIFLRQNLLQNPVTTSMICSYFGKHCSTSSKKIQNFYSDVIKDELSEYTSFDRISTLISLARWDDAYRNENINAILESISLYSFRQFRKQLLVSLLPHEQPELLKITSELIQRNEPHREFKLTPEYMLELCYQDKAHWLLKAAEVYKQQLHDMKNVTFKINNFTKQILILVLIELTNSPESFDLTSLVCQLSNIFSILDTYTTADDHLQFYITEIKRELTIIKFCLENNSKIMTTSVFSQVLKQSALSVISQVCRLSKVDRYKVSRLLNSNNDMILEMVNLNCNNGAQEKTFRKSNWDIVTFNSFCAITKIIDTILDLSEQIDNAPEISNSLDEIKRLVFSIQPAEHSIELIENLYTCLFLRYEYFSTDDHSQEIPCGTHSDCSYFYSKKQIIRNEKSGLAGFISNSLTTQIILNTLKLCLEYVEKNIDKKNVDQIINTRLKHLLKVVNHSIWKLQLASTLSPETNNLQLKLCLDYVEVDESSDDENSEVDAKALRKKPKNKRKFGNLKLDVDHPMVSSTLSASDNLSCKNKINNIDFISVMLAKPNCLVALALYQNDFAKANQIIEMFDLADAEIATEVIFTEHLRHLVAKIKNIIYYRDDTRYATKELSALSVVSTEVMSLVEGFLASNRASNSFDIIELGSRHPHLQLYGHQNAPFINAVDILLSSGLNREITYGLINVVERKLAEVRSSTDVSAGKKTNYIRFVEDIASVMFEVFGTTEKSFNFADNICSLITDCRIPIKHKEFCKLNQLAKELKQSCEDLSDVIDYKESIKIDPGLLQKYHQIYMNVVSASDKDICNINEVSRQSSKKTRIHYLRMCYIYCKTVAHLEEDDNKSLEYGTEKPYFSILDKSWHNIFGIMINNKEITIAQLEPICKKLNVNLIPKLILTFCPPISISGKFKESSEMVFNNMLQTVYDYKNGEENLFLDPETNFAPIPCKPDPQSLTYIILHNWVLAHIIKKIYTSSSDDPMHQSIDSRTKCLNNFMELERFDCTKIIFGGNKYLSSLHSIVDLEKLFTYLPQLVKSGKLLKCLNIIDALSERQLLSSPNLINLRDLILFKLATHPNVSSNWKCCEHLHCPELKLNLVLNNLCHWPAEGALDVLDYLRFLLDTVSIEDGIYQKCNDWMRKIPLYDQISSVMAESHWYNVYEKSLENPEYVIEKLMENQQFKLCLEWADEHEVSENMKSLITTNLLRQLFEYTSQASSDMISELLHRLPTNQALDLVTEEMSKIRNVELLQACIEFVTTNSTDWRKFENIKIGLLIMIEIHYNLRVVFWDLIERPLLMLEQFLMNAKLEVLSDIINKISPNLRKDPNGDNLYYNMQSIETLVISRNAVDALLRFYAEKALDISSIRNPPPPLRSTENVLLQSIDSINLESASKPFVMPELVPTKDQWVEDYSVERCMVCSSSIFSMIMRRHHCRRCGRLVCHSCSTNRMQVPTYPSGVKFRVCNDCYTQTMSMKSKLNSDDVEANFHSSHSDSLGSGITCMDWCLSLSPKKNQSVRDEFSYEFTPNVTLCLTLMKMHSINLDYPRFLLARSDKLSPEESGCGDARLLLRARRSLLLAAVELYSRIPSDHRAVAEQGASHASRLLAHTDAAATLVLRHAHHLLPKHATHPSQIIRSLLENEKWDLALEIATKTGLTRNGVLAAWGKACLKAGCFKQAREKFAHCFKNTLNLSVDAVEDCEYGREASELVHKRLQSLRFSGRSNSMSSVQSDGRPKRNLPLLNEIIIMLEDMNYPVNPQLLAKAEVMKSTNEKLTVMNVTKKKLPLSEPALNIMHILASVKKIKQGDYSDFQTAPVQKKGLAQGILFRTNSHSEPKINYKKLDPFFFKECIYYLTNYGSYSANIAFYIKHSDLKEVLTYCYDSMVDKETFTESVYMDCLKKDKVNDLLEVMSEMDGTWDMWADYLMHICRTLEMSKRLEALFAIQVGTNQHAKAPATCALLYSRKITSLTPFATLNQRQGHLTAALYHLGQCVPVSSKASDPKSFNFHLDKATIDNLYIKVTRQIELAKYLAASESQGYLTAKVLNEVIPLQVKLGTDVKDNRPLTLFGTNTDKIRLVAVVLVANKSVQDGFNLAFKILTENKLDSMSVYTHVARYLVEVGRYMEVKTLAKCIRDSKETAANLMSDQVLEAGVSAVVKRCEPLGQLHDEQAEVLIHDIHSLSIKVSCYLVCRNLNNAYILAANKHRTNDLRRIQQEAERNGNEKIRNACINCIKRLTNKNIS